MVDTTCGGYYMWWLLHVVVSTCDGHCINWSLPLQQSFLSCSYAYSSVLQYILSCMCTYLTYSNILYRRCNEDHIDKHQHESVRTVHAICSNTHMPPCLHPPCTHTCMSMSKTQIFPCFLTSLTALLLQILHIMRKQIST